DDHGDIGFFKADIRHHFPCRGDDILPGLGLLQGLFAYCVGARHRHCNPWSPVSIRETCRGSIPEGAEPATGTRKKCRPEIASGPAAVIPGSEVVSHFHTADA